MSIPRHLGRSCSSYDNLGSPTVTSAVVEESADQLRFKEVGGYLHVHREKKLMASQSMFLP